jgi:hypothetical protein
LSGPQPELAESFSEAVRADVSLGFVSGEQPLRGALITEPGVADVGRHPVHDGVGGEDPTEVVGCERSISIISVSGTSRL